MKYSRLSICSLTHELKAQTCSYWYTVRDSCMAHTAFETRKAAIAWLTALGLSIDGELPEEGTHGYFPINGEYRRELVMCSEDAFSALPGVPFPVFENGGYRPGKLHKCDGETVLYVVNVNCKWAKEFDYWQCRELKRQGLTIF